MNEPIFSMLDGKDNGYCYYYWTTCGMFCPGGDCAWADADPSTCTSGHTCSEPYPYMYTGANLPCDTHPFGSVIAVPCV